MTNKIIDVKVGDKVHIIHMEGEPEYENRSGVV